MILKFMMADLTKDCITLREVEVGHHSLQKVVRFNILVPAPAHQGSGIVIITRIVIISVTTTVTIFQDHLDMVP